MSQVSVDIRTFGGIVSDFFRGKASVPQAEQRLQTLGQTIVGQAEGDVAQTEHFLGPQAVAAIKSGLVSVSPAIQAGLSIMDADLQPYGAAFALTLEGGVDALMGAAGAGFLDKLANGSIDTLEQAGVAAVHAQFAAWKAKLAAQTAAAAAAPAHTA